MVLNGNLKDLFKIVRVEGFRTWNRKCSTKVNGSQKKSYMHHLGTKPLQYCSLGQMLEASANKWPQRTVIISRHENLTMTYSELLEKADKLAAGLCDIGLERGDRLGIWSPNCTQWLVVMFAAARAGLISVCINPSYINREIEYSLNKVDVKALIVPDTYKETNYYKILTEVIPELRFSKPGELKSANVKSLNTVILLNGGNDLPGTISYDKLLISASSSEVGRVGREQHLVKPDDGCNIQFTSGTTGAPKAALLSHYNILNNGYNIGTRNEICDGHNKMCLQIPFFHVFGVVEALCCGLQHGATFVVPSGTYSSTANVDALLAEKCHLVYGTPTMYTDLVNTVKARGISNIEVQTVVTGGAPITPRLVKDMINVLKVRSIKSVFGMTEGTGVSFQSLTGEDPQRCLHYLGHLHDHLEAKVVDINNDLVPFGTPGELLIRGYSLMKGYWGDKSKTEATIDKDGWLRTGDQVILHEDGYAQIVGRLKDIIIRGGENIAPKEIEDVLSSHPDVSECYVFPVKDDRLGEDICVAVRLQDGVDFSPEKLSKHCSSTLAKYKVPRLFKSVDSFPKTASGKIQKFKLREMVESGKL